MITTELKQQAKTILALQEGNHAIESIIMRILVRNHPLNQMKWFRLWGTMNYDKTTKLFTLIGDYHLQLVGSLKNIANTGIDALIASYPKMNKVFSFYKFSSKQQSVVLQNLTTKSEKLFRCLQHTSLDNKKLFFKTITPLLDECVEELLSYLLNYYTNSMLTLLHLYSILIQNQISLAPLLVHNEKTALKSWDRDTHIFLKHTIYPVILKENSISAEARLIIENTILVLDGKFLARGA